MSLPRLTRKLAKECFVGERLCLTKQSVGGGGSKVNIFEEKLSDENSKEMRSINFLLLFLPPHPCINNFFPIIWLMFKT